MAPAVRFGKYQLLGKIAQGGMAQILLARAQGVSGFEKLVVIKRILPQYSQDQEFIRMFIDEAKIAAQLNHQNICHIYDLGAVGEYYFIAMEYIEGRDVHSIIRYARKRKKYAKKSSVVFVLSEVCKGLSYAHNRKDADGRPLGLIHRDISPSNILISFDGDVKIVDFGIARASKKSSNTEAGIIKGKFSYLSTEQANGKEIDKRSDIFSLGAVMYEMFTGERLFNGKDDLTTLKMVQQCELPDFDKLDYQFDDDLLRILKKALAKNPDDRYQDASEMQSDLVTYLNRKYPGYTSQKLAEYMRDLFKTDLERITKRTADMIKAADAGDVVDEGPLMDAGLLSVPGSYHSGGSYPAVGTPQSPYPFASSTPSGLKKSPMPWIFGTLVLFTLIAGVIASIFLLKPTESKGPTLGVIIAQSDPPGAEIILDGVEMNIKTPATIENVPTGVQHTLSFSLGGYEPVTETVIFPPKATYVTVSPKLGKSTAHLEISTDPPDVSVLIDGEEKGKTPLKLDVTPNKLFSLELKSDGYEPMKQDLVLRKGEVRTFNTSLKKIIVVKKFGYLEINTIPWTYISIDGRSINKTTPLIGYKLEAGEHTITLENPSFGVKKVIKVDIPAGGTVKKMINLQ
ncbi:MAG: hypothetical protein Kow0090_21590 [Myxococcota bacterium]